MSIQICEEGRQDIIKSMEAYINDLMELSNSDWCDEEDHDMYHEDITLARSALAEFKEDWDWTKLYDTLMDQDSEARDLAFYHLRNVNEWLDFVEDQLRLAQGCVCIVQ